MRDHLRTLVAVASLCVLVTVSVVAQQGQIIVSYGGVGGGDVGLHLFGELAKRAKSDTDADYRDKHNGPLRNARRPKYLEPIVRFPVGAIALVVGCRRFYRERRGGIPLIAIGCALLLGPW